MHHTRIFPPHLNTIKPAFSMQYGASDVVRFGGFVNRLKSFACLISHAILVLSPRVVRRTWSFVDSHPGVLLYSL